ncbi:MAG TPA: DUF1328 domain-containing protein [Nitrospira sp.]
MLYNALMFVVAGLMAGSLHFSGIPLVAIQISWILFLIGIVLAAIHFAWMRPAAPET